MIALTFTAKLYIVGVVGVCARAATGVWLVKFTLFRSLHSCRPLLAYELHVYMAIRGYSCGELTDQSPQLYYRLVLRQLLPNLVPLILHFPFCCVFFLQNPMPKMSIFCFLIDEVRSTTSLEIPDSNSCFAIKVHAWGLRVVIQCSLVGWT